jgi:hypothetical protein
MEHFTDHNFIIFLNLFAIFFEIDIHQFHIPILWNGNMKYAELFKFDFWHDIRVIV